VFSAGLHKVDSPVPVPAMGTPTMFSRFTAPDSGDRDSTGVFMVESQRVKMQLENMMSLVFMMCQNKKTDKGASFGVGRMDRAQGFSLRWLPSCLTGPVNEHDTLLVLRK